MTKKRKRIILSVLGISILTLALLIVTYLFWDESPSKDDDLVFIHEEVSDVDNAYFYLTQLKGKVTDIDLNDMKQLTNMKLGEEKWDKSLIEGYIKKNEEAFKILQKAFVCKNYQPLSHSRIPYRSTTHLKPVRELTRQLSYSAYKMIYGGKSEEALDISFKLLILGQLMQNGKGGIIDYYDGKALKIKGFDLLRFLRC